MAEFLHMGGYAFYVWTSYGIGLLVIAANVIAAMRCDQATRAELSRRLRRGRKSA